MNWFQLLYTPTLPNKTNCFIRNFQRVNDKYFFIQIHPRDPYNAPALSISQETKPETLVNLQLTINPRRSAAVPNRGRTFCSFVSASPLSLKPKLFQPNCQFDRFLLPLTCCCCWFDRVLLQQVWRFIFFHLRPEKGRYELAAGPESIRTFTSHETHTCCCWCYEEAEVK